MKLSKSFIPLPFSFDAAKLAEEAIALPDSAWISHPNGFKGNSAAALISKGAGDNNLFNGRMSITPHLEKSPYHQQVLASFNEILGRSRLMKLDPGAKVFSHVDVNYHWHARIRIHVPIITNPGVIFHCGHDQLHMRAGDCWIFDSWQAHQVVNDSPHTRIHLVIDASGSSRFWKTVRDMEVYDHKTNLDDLGEAIRFIPYRDGVAATVPTENYNIAPIMAPGEMDALIDDLIRDFDGNPTNDSAVAESYKRFLADFAMDWRQTWHAYGYSEEGWPHYQMLVRALQGRIKPRNRQAVVLKSNGISANIVIIKRLVESAMNVEVLSELI